MILTRQYYISMESLQDRFRAIFTNGFDIDHMTQISRNVTQALEWGLPAKNATVQLWIQVEFDLARSQWWDKFIDLHTHLHSCFFLQLHPKLNGSIYLHLQSTFADSLWLVHLQSTFERSSFQDSATSAICNCLSGRILSAAVAFCIHTTPKYA